MIPLFSHNVEKWPLNEKSKLTIAEVSSNLKQTVVDTIHSTHIEIQLFSCSGLNKFILPFKQHLSAESYIKRKLILW